MDFTAGKMRRHMHVDRDETEYEQQQYRKRQWSGSVLHVGPVSGSARVLTIKMRRLFLLENTF
jgi:hypothetical protein